MRLTERTDDGAGRRAGPRNDSGDTAAQLVWALSRPGRAEGGGRHRRWPPDRVGARRAVVLAVAAVLLATAFLVALGGAERLGAGSPVIRGWVTTPDGQQLLAAQAPISFRDRAPTSSLTVTVSPTREYQTVDGFGASLTDSSAAALSRLDPQERDAVLVRLFQPGKGAGLSYLRQPMGASDFVAGNFYTYDDVAPGGTDYDMQHFSIEHDQREILPLLRRAKALNPQLTVIASPWSAPAWMKTSGSLVGGSLVDDPRVYRAYALYFVKFLQAYARAGVPVAGVTVQNEPQFAPSDYPGMLMAPTQEATFISVLGPALKAAGLHVSILAYDHNWAVTPATTTPAATSADDYVQHVLSDPAAAPWIGGIAFHCYGGQVAEQAQVHQRFPRAGIVLTECSGYRAPRETRAAAFARSLGATARLVVEGTRNWAGAVLTWNVALGPQSGPHRGGCGTCTGLVTLGPGNTVTPTADFYALASAGRVVRPGAVRIDSSSFPLTGDKGGLITAAFRNRDGSIGLLADNLTAVPRPFTVQVGDRSFTTTLAAGALGAYAWPGTATPVGDLVPIDPSQMTATASPAAPVDPCCTGDVASRVLDDDAGTRWSTGRSQRPGDYLQVDLGQRRRVFRVVLDAGTAPGDAPRRWVLYAGDDPAALGAPVAEGVGAGQLTRSDLRGIDARYLRVATTATTSAWWSVAEISVYVHR